MPSFCAACGDCEARPSSPANSIVPASGGCAPERILRSVDLPAPFSPSSAWISPGATSRSTSLERLHAGKALADARHAQERLGHEITRRRDRNPSHFVGRGVARRAGERQSGRKALSPQPAGSRTRQERLRLLIAYCTSPMRSASLMLSLVMAIGRQQDELLGLGAVAQELDQRLHRAAALAARELLDRRGQRAVADRGQRLGQRVEADRRRRR